MRQRVFSGSPFESQVGFCRAIRVGDTIHISGTAPLTPEGATACPGDAYGQTKRCFEIIEAAVRELGGSLSDIVRTRMYLTRLDAWPEVARAHGELFGTIQPAATALVVSGLVRSDWLVEIEADAIIAQD